MILPPVTRLTVASVELSNGVKFQLVHDLKESGGNKSFEGSYKQWIKKTRDFTANSFIRFVKNRQPDSIFLLKEDFDRITEGKTIPATKEEYDAENN